MPSLAQQAAQMCDDCYGKDRPLAWFGPNIRICGPCRQKRVATTSAPPALGGDEGSQSRSAPNKAPDAAEVVVPREPSPAMIAAARSAIAGDAKALYRGEPESVTLFYRAMISTAEQEAHG